MFACQDEDPHLLANRGFKAKESPKKMRHFPGIFQEPVKANEQRGVPGCLSKWDFGRIPHFAVPGGLASDTMDEPTRITEDEVAGGPLPIVRQ
jgi:hypothetical protein